MNNDDLNAEVIRARCSRFVIWLGWFVFLTSICAQFIKTDFRCLQNADLYYLPVLAKDVMEWGGRFSEWMLTPAPYYFPDMAIYFPIYGISRNCQASLILAGVVQFLLFAGGWILLCCRLAVSKQNQFAAHALTLLISACIMTFASLRELAIGSLQITFHFGVIACMPWVLLLAGVLINTETPWKRVVLSCLMFALISILTASDSLTVGQIAGPLCVSLLYMFILKGSGARRNIPVILIIAAGVIVGFCFTRTSVFKVLVSMYLSSDSSVSVHSSNDVSLLLQNWMLKHEVPAFLGISAFCLHLYILAISIRRTTINSCGGSGLAFISSFTVFSTVASVVAVACACNFPGRVEIRYLLPVLFLPLFAMPVLVACVSLPERGSRTKQLYTGAAVIFGVILACNIGSLSRAPELIERYSGFYPDLAQWVDQEASEKQLTCGVADYWDAKTLALLTKKNIKIIQSTSELEPMNWISNTKWYDRYLPDFIICTTNRNDKDRIRERKVLERFGMPDERVERQGVIILVYRPEQHEEFRSWFSKHPCRVKFRNAGDKAVFDASEFPGLTGRIEGHSRVAETPGDLEGFLTYGYYFTLPAGTYMITITYLAQPETMAGHIGRWGVTTPEKRNTVIMAEGALSADSREVRAEITLSRDQSIEIRTRLCGNGRLTVHRIGVERVR